MSKTKTMSKHTVGAVPVKAKTRTKEEQAILEGLEKKSQLAKAKFLKEQAKKLPPLTDDYPDALDWDNLDALTWQARQAAIKKYLAQVQSGEGEQKVEAQEIKKQCATRNAINDAIKEAREAREKNSRPITGNYWRLGKLLIAEKPLHNGGWVEWCSGIGLNKNTVSRAMTIAEKFPSAAGAEKVSLRKATAAAPKTAGVILARKISNFKDWLAKQPTTVDSVATIADAIDSLAALLAKVKAALAKPKSKEEADAILAGKAADELLS